MNAATVSTEFRTAARIAADEQLAAASERGQPLPGDWTVVEASDVVPLALHQVVRLAIDPVHPRLKRGDCGTVIHMHDVPEVAYEVEFAVPEGRPISEVFHRSALASIDESHSQPVHHSV